LRQVSHMKILILLACLALTGWLAHLRPPVQVRTHQVPLEQAVVQVGDWRKVGMTPLSQAIFDELKLDDYVFQSYSRGDGQVFLYVGYYHTAKKVGAAHDPLVCFPGQGWKVSDIRCSSFNVSGDREREINYSSMIAERDEERELVLYWFQAADRTTAGTLAQKLVLFRQKLLNRGESNAFVRISTSLGKESPENARDRILAFVRDFYPDFFDYVTGR